ncbi:Trehalose transport system permease protein SugA [Hartmannibacter diazotrophicus]|uniref:Trehalose transport system permease protein SugA n=1 Tax=Hartmannibacter diazotrophicus TaxID=1482074 RepID=A0A2C9D9E3_9HYPH|nr:sugar ABC transporter permease [Hartmannibacter diazotrophicus]SON56790.1 Trehalose transport system permease protein SugA [Hartmannibacter diazotrophicus]
MNNVRTLPYLLLLPATAFLLVFFLLPFFGVAVEAFTGPGGELGFANFQSIAFDWKFWPAITNTLTLTALVVPIQLALALAMASLVMSLKAGRDVVLYIFTIPLGISDLAAGIVWLAILEQNGFLNGFLHALGLIDGPQNLLTYNNLPALFVAVVAAEIWRATAIILVILVAGMGLIPKEYHEAAEVFGAGRWTRFRKITLPLLRPSLQTALILRVILSFEVFAVVAVLAGSNLPVLMGETFEWQFNLQDSKGAAAYAMIVLGLSIAFTVAILWLLRDRTKGETA